MKLLKMIIISNSNVKKGQCELDHLKRTVLVKITRRMYHIYGSMKITNKQ